MFITEVFDVEAARRFERSPGPGLAQRLQMLLFALDEQHVLVQPAEEKRLGDSVGYHLVPEVLGVERLELGEHLVSGVVSRRLGALRHTARVRGRAPRQHDGQRVRRELQERLHSPGLCADHNTYMARILRRLFCFCCCYLFIFIFFVNYYYCDYFHAVSEQRAGEITLSSSYLLCRR